MDRELILRQFEEIENRVEGLIAKCKSQEAANAELTEKISRLEAELEQKTAAENRFVEEKELIRSKIDGLLSKFDAFSEMRSS